MGAKVGSASPRQNSNALMGALDDSLPPSVRTAKIIEKTLGANRAGRAACMALATGQELTQSQKKAIFRIGRARGIDAEAMVSMVKQTDGVGLTPMELENLQAAAAAAEVPANLLNGFGWRAAENAGPGTN